MSVGSTQFSAQAALLAGQPIEGGDRPLDQGEWENILSIRAKAQVEKQAKDRKENILIGGTLVVGLGTAITVTVLLAKFVFNLNPYAAVASTAASIVVAVLINNSIAKPIFQEGWPRAIASLLLASAITVLCVNPLGFSVTFLGASVLNVTAYASFALPVLAIAMVKLRR